ncbi:hypothetical protein Scep_019428 [Stephania cephalantha]|uniref:DUF4283 domain-containing protein n=1 Tax=Stephania cephalantha TaxID=152367 RepID=A0AAP0NMX1_9MAGN
MPEKNKDPTKKVRFREGTLEKPLVQEDDASMETHAEAPTKDDGKQPSCDNLSHKERLLGDRMFGTGKNIRLEEGDIVVDSNDKGEFLRISERLLKLTREPWKYAVVVKLIRRNIGYRTLCDKIKEMWRPENDYRVVDMQNNFFMIQLATAEDMNEALLGGPWIIMGHCLSVQRWSPSFSATTSLITKVFNPVAISFDSSVSFGLTPSSSPLFLRLASGATRLAVRPPPSSVSRSAASQEHLSVVADFNLTLSSLFGPSLPPEL